MEIEKAIESFVADLQLAGRQPLTIEAHTGEIGRLAAWCKQNGIEWYQLERAQLQRYARTKASFAPSTRANSFTSWRVFFRWCVEQQIMGMSPAAGFHTPMKPKPVPRALTRDQVRRLVHYLKTCEGRPARRDETLIITAMYAGLRCAELATLCWPAVDLSGLAITIRLSKMNHGRTIPIHPQLASQLASWREHQAGAGDWPVYSLDGRPLAPARPGKICHRVSRASGITFNTHALRHTFATWMLRSSRDLYAVSKALGHSQLQQTEVYLSADAESTRAAVGMIPALTAW